MYDWHYWVVVVLLAANVYLTAFTNHGLGEVMKILSDISGSVSALEPPPVDDDE
jgi:hypothetical protein